MSIAIVFTKKSQLFARSYHKAKIRTTSKEIIWLGHIFETIETGERYWRQLFSVQISRLLWWECVGHRYCHHRYSFTLTKQISTKTPGMTAFPFFSFFFSFDIICDIFWIYVNHYFVIQFNFQLKSIPVEINPSLIINPTPITLSKDQLMRHASKTDQSCEILIEVSYVEHQNAQNNGMKIKLNPHDESKSKIKFCLECFF